MLEQDHPWSYTARARALMRQSQAVLDLGTGGGERMLMLAESWPARVVATEPHPPNFRLARERLAPLGAEVLEIPVDEVTAMPLGDAAFDLVLNRHSAIHVDEIARMLAPTGVFLTQQVHGLWASDLLKVFGARPQWPEAAPEKYVPWLLKAGFEITDLREWEGRLQFTDVGAIVYYLKAVPWLVPGFSVKGHLEALLSLQRLLDAGEALAFSARKYLIEAKKL
jgi:SAM-dependent methyltransferase